MGADAFAPGPRGASPGSCGPAERCAPYQSAVLALPRSFCLDEPMALGWRRQRSIVERRRSNSTLPQQPTRDPRRRHPDRRAVLDLRRAGSPLSVVAGPLKRPNALASAARAPINSVTGAERRRPCRLHAVIRTLVLDQPGTLAASIPPLFRRAPWAASTRCTPERPHRSRGALRALTGEPCSRGRDLSAPESRWLWAGAASAPGAEPRRTNSTPPQQSDPRSAADVPGMPLRIGSTPSHGAHDQLLLGR